MKGIKFNDVHSYRDLNLVLSKVDISPATPKTNFIDIPGGDGSVDATEAVGEVKFNDRKCTFTFAVLPTDNYEDKKTAVSNLLNGKRCKIILDKDPNYYYLGRLSVDEYASSKQLKQIVIGATVAPYKLKLAETVVYIPAGEEVNAVLNNGRKAVVPTITNTKPATIVFGGQTSNINAGTHKLLGIWLKQGENPITVTSDDPVKFSWQEGDL